MSRAARVRRPGRGAKRGQWLTLIAGLAVAATMVLVAEDARRQSERHLHAQVLIERIRAASQEISAISWEGLANTWSRGSQRLHLEPETVTRGFTAWRGLKLSVDELLTLERTETTETLERDAAALYESGLRALAIASRGNMQAAVENERRRFRPALRRLNVDAKRAGMHQRTVAADASRSAKIAFVGSLAFGLLALALLGLRLQSFRRQVTLADELREIERRSEERLRALLEHSNDVVTVVDRDQLVKWQAASVERMLGHDPASLVGQRLTNIVHPDDARLLERFLTASIKRPGSARLSVRFRHADGYWRHVEAVAENRLHDPAVGGIVLSLRDVSEHKALEDELRHQAFHDALTGLANRALFEDRLTHALAGARRNDRSFAVLFLDLDDFKTINDSLGHVRGDELLEAVARRIQGTLRSADTAARLGGDEFAVLIELARDEDADLVAARIFEALRPPFRIDGRDLRVTASIGVAYSAGSHGVEDLLRHADMAMYAAKEQGKAAVRTFEPGMHRRAVHRLELTAELREAIEDGQFQLDYQPIVELEDAQPVGVEALVRWQHPDRGPLAPDQFVELAEETGMIVPLGLWILESACTEIEALRLMGEDLELSVNVSTRQLQEPEFAESVAEVLRRTRLAPGTLTLEITEGFLRGDHDSMLRQLERLRALDVRIAIDDFGTGYSSLSHLRHFPIDTLKIDRSFIAEIDSDVGKAKLVRGIFNLGASLHLDVVAEGIEREEQAAQLRSMGVRFGQGFLFSPPVSPTALDGLLMTEGVGGPGRPAPNAVPTPALPPVVSSGG